MQFGSLTVEQWDRQLASPTTSPPSSPQTAAPPPLLALTSNTTPPSSPPKKTAHPPPASEIPAVPSPPPVTIEKKRDKPSSPAPPSLPQSSSTSSSTAAKAAPVPPQALTWAARVASGRAGVSAAAQNLPAPRRIARTSAVLPSATQLASADDAREMRGQVVSPTDVQAVRRGYSPPRRRRRSQLTLPSRRLRGLINGGNCCFINVVLQALLACDAFRQLLHECADAPDQSLVRKFVRLVREMDAGGPAMANGRTVDAIGNSGGGKEVSCQPLAMKDGALVKEEALLADWFYDVFPSSGGTTSANGRGVANGCAVGNGGSAGGSQEDAEEFLNYVLNHLHEELMSWEGGNNDKSGGGEVENGENEEGQFHTIDGRIHTMNGSTGGCSGGEDDVWTEMTRSGKSVEIRGGEFAQSGITDIFGGALRSEVKRARAKPSVTREPFFSLSLDVESGMIRDVDDALKAYFETEFLEGYTMEGGDGGKGLAVDARKQVLLMQMPQVLILHLKRFSHNSVTGALNKVSRNMMFPETLRVPGSSMHCARNRWGCEGGKAYELMAVVTHVGKELAGGHYTCDVRWDGDDGERVWFNCDDSKVVRTNLQKVCRKQAYLLFYSAVRGE